MRSPVGKYRAEVVRLRSKGYTFTEIRNLLKAPIPRSTMSGWCKYVILAKSSRQRIARIVLNNMSVARRKSLVDRSRRRVQFWNALFQNSKRCVAVLSDRRAAKLVLAALFIGEGSKKASSSLVFGNSNVHVIQLFLRLLRDCYIIDETKFRCTVQCRADQDQQRLVLFWSDVTGIPMNQFYRSRVDLRTVGKPSMQQGYKGVCRIDYFSADVYNELRTISSVLFGLDYLGL